MSDSSLNNLAETLAKNGLACSASEAMRMAKSILGTEKKVARHFDDEAEKIDESLSKKTYQEEIDDLIEKTSPEKKDFHYMVSGYKNDASREKEEFSAVDDALNSTEESKMESCADELEKEHELVVEPVISAPIHLETSSDNEIEHEVPSAKVQEEKVDEIQENTVIPTESNVQPVEEPSLINLVSKEPESQVSIEPEPIMQNQSENKNQAIADAVNNAKAVYTDVADDNRMLKDIMDEQANEIYNAPKTLNKANEPVVDEASPTDSNNDEDIAMDLEELNEKTEVEESSPEYNVFNFEPTEEPAENEPVSMIEELVPVLDELKIQNNVTQEQPAVQNAVDQEEITSNSDEFILPVSESQEPRKEESVVKQQPMEEPKREFKNPIQEVNLMDHFKFG